MFEKNMRLAYLIDFYIDLLDSHSQSILRAYYDDDLSLAEIASGEGISRQGIRHIIKKGEEQLDFLETKLGLAAHYTELEAAIEKLTKVVENIKTDTNTDDSLKYIFEVIATIQNKGI